MARGEDTVNRCVVISGKWNEKKNGVYRLRGKDWIRFIAMVGESEIVLKRRGQV